MEESYYSWHTGVVSAIVLIVSVVAFGALFGGGSTVCVVLVFVFAVSAGSFICMSVGWLIASTRIRPDGLRYVLVTWYVVRRTSMNDIGLPLSPLA